MDNPIHCLICGAPLSYRDKAASLTCAGCGKTFMSYAQCERGHYICDACHSKAGLLAIGYICQETSETDAFALAATLIKRRDFRPENFAVYHPGGSLGQNIMF